MKTATETSEYEEIRGAVKFLSGIFLILLFFFTVILGLVTLASHTPGGDPIFGGHFVLAAIFQVSFWRFRLKAFGEIPIE